MTDVIVNPPTVFAVEVGNVGGSQGEPGEDGYSPQWRSGSGAPSGALGNVTDWYLNTTSGAGKGDAYEKTGASTWTLRANIVGPQGATGTSGTNGTNGYSPQWRSGSGAPSGALGAVTDWYLNTANGDAYEKTGASTWTLRANLTGPQGIQGIQGVPGTDGTDGVDGVSPIWRSGSGAPAGALGNVADWYVNIIAGSGRGDVYEKTGASTWTLRTNLIGPAGPANTLHVLSVTTGAPGTPVEIEISGAGPDQYIDFTIPRGATGATGATGADGPVGPGATVTVGDVVMVPNEFPPTITNVGTATAAELDFEIPYGPRGFTGSVGPVGPVGATFAATISSGVFTLDPSKGTEYTLTASGNFSISASGLSNGAHFYLALVQDGVGGRAITLPSDWVGVSDVVLSTVANTIDILVVWRSPIGYHVNRIWTGALPSSYWSPNALANRVAWYQGLALPGDEGDTVASWTNQWASSHLVSTGTPTLHIANGQRYVSFNGTTDYMDATHSPSVSQPFMVAFVAKVSTAGPVISGSQNTAHDINIESGNWTMEPASGLTRPNSGVWSTVVCQYISGGNDKIRVNGSELNTINVNTLKVATYTRIAAEEGGTKNAMSIAELIKTSANPDSTTLANLETYLNKIRDDLNGA